MAELATWLFDNLPEVTKWRDASEQGGQLKEICTVLSGSFDGLKTDTDAFVQLIDADACPSAFLPMLASMLGFDFPFDLADAQQRAFLRNAVAVYRSRGSPSALVQGIGRLIGSDFVVDITGEDYVGHTLSVTVAGSENSITMAGDPLLENKVFYLIGQLTPAGIVPTLLFVYFGADTYQDELVDAETCIEETAWQTNRLGHNLNSFGLPTFAFSCNAFGQVLVNT